MIWINLNNFGKIKKFIFLLEKIFFIRNYIVTEIMQATAIKNLLKEGVISNGMCLYTGEKNMHNEFF